MMTETVVTVQDGSQHQNNTKLSNDNNHSPGGVGNNQQSTQSSSLAWIKINLDYFKTLPGMLKIAQVLIAIICMACASPAFKGSTHFFLFVVTTGFLMTIIWIFIYLLGVREALNLPINWILTELVNTAIFAGLYLISSIIQLSAWSGASYRYQGGNIAGGIFGLFNTLAYSVGAYLLYVEWKNTQIN